MNDTELMKMYLDKCEKIHKLNIYFIEHQESTNFNGEYALNKLDLFIITSEVNQIRKHLLKKSKENIKKLIEVRNDLTTITSVDNL